MTSTGGSEDAGWDLCLRLTSRRVPENVAQKDRTGLPFGVTVQPFKPLPHFPVDASARLDPADEVARCGDCFGYVNGFCGLERDGWVCILCGNFSYWSSDPAGDSGKPRYKRNARRNELPEIALPEYEIEVAREVLTVNPREPLGTAPVYVALIDTTAPEETLELVRSAVLAAIEAVGPDALFGIVTFADRIGLLDVQNLSVRRVGLGKNGGLAMPLEDALPLRRLLAPVGAFKEELAAAVETIAPAETVAPAGQTADGGGGGTAGVDAAHTPRRAFGPALEATLAWLGADGVGVGDDVWGAGSEGGGGGDVRHPSCRVLSFLAGMPNFGDGALDDGLYRECAADLDSPDHEEASKATDALAQPSVDFYADAGARAALAAVVVDVFSLGGDDSFADLASVAPLTEQSGGALHHYATVGGVGVADAPLPRDVFRLLRAESTAHHCTLRMRTSAEFEVAGTYGATVPDDVYPGLHHVVRCGPNDCFAFDFRHKSAAGFGRRGDCPPTAQLAFEYTALTRLPPDPATQAARYLRQRRRRVCTAQARVATSPKDVFSTVDAECVVSLLTHKILATAEERGLTEARTLLSDWLVILTSRFNHETGVAKFDPKDTAAVDGTFTSCAPLQHVPRMVFALLRSTLLRPRGVPPDVRTRLRHLAKRLDPASLSRLLYPRLSSYSDVDTLMYPRHSLSRTALTTSNGAVFIVDAFDVVVVYYAPAQPGSERALSPYPPPQSSAVRTAVNALREARDVTPRVVYIRGGAEDPAPFHDLLIEEQDVDGLEGGSSGGFVGFLQTVEGQARRFMREA